MGMKLPNILTSVRIALSPFVYYAGFAHEKLLFIFLFALCGLTDALDGFFARYLNLKSDWGNAFDTVADIVFYPSVLMIYFFEPEVFQNHWTILIILLSLFAIAMIIRWLHGRLRFPHLLSAKIFAVFMVAFVLLTAIVDYYPIFFYVVAVVGTWSAVEQFVVLFRSHPVSRGGLK